MNQIARTFILVGLVVVILLAMHLLPTPQIGETELRPVNILSDVVAEPEQASDIIDIPVVPTAPIANANVNANDNVNLNPNDNLNNPNTQLPTPNTPLDLRSLATSGTQEHPTPNTPPTDTLLAGNEQPVEQLVVSPDSVVMIVDYSSGAPGGMSHFYAQLARVQSLGRPVRVAYYGDSFIEGDILSGDVRELLQSQFGGQGVGWVDCGSKVHGFRQTVVHNYSGFSEHEVVSKPFNGALQSISQRYFLPTGSPRITLTGTNRRRHVSQWQRSTFYLRSEGGCSLTARIQDVDTTFNYQVTGSPIVQAIPCEIDTMPTKSITWSVGQTGRGTTLFGIALESRSGVIVDNFSMRGSAGFTIANIPMETLRQFAAIRPYDLIIIQFGLNVANARQTNYRTYIDRLGQAIDHLRQAFPTASILVMSCPDRDQRTAQGIRTMNGVEQLIAYQQLMASEHRVAFLNLFQAMGGRESMKGLVDRGLANKDYTHLNFGGGKQIAKPIVQSLLAGYHAAGY